ncbi:MAG: hypothetical protein HUK17_00450 [Bacteroidales bacterium]|nr:hypothetical protein [Bacteroidales bacterium]
MRKVLLSLFMVSLLVSLSAQSGIYIPSAKPIKKMKEAMHQPEKFCVFIKYTPGDTTYSTADLDILDSAYNMAFDRSNPRLYSMKIEGFGGSDTRTTETRVNGIYKYFALRSHSLFPIRYAVNQIHCSCHGDTIETLRYEVPVDRQVYVGSTLPESRKVLRANGVDISLDGGVLITFTHNPDDCIGMARGCVVPSMDTTVRGYYASVYMPKGILYQVTDTKDSCPSNVQFSIEEHLDYKEVLDRYFLVPHKKQVIIQVGYVVLHSSLNRQYGECSQELKDSILVRFPVTQEQFDNKIRIFGKKHSEKGTEFKSLTSKKVPSKISINVQCAINVTQLDTLFLGKRIQPEELSDYFYECDTDMEQGSFKAYGKFWKAYRFDKHGEYEIKKPLRALLRIVEDEPEPIEEQKQDKRYADDEEIE